MFCYLEVPHNAPSHLLEPDVVLLVHLHPHVLRWGDVDVETPQLLRCPAEHLCMTEFETNHLVRACRERPQNRGCML